MRRIKELAGTISGVLYTIKEINGRLKRLECNHDIELVESGDYFSEKCSKCGKFFRSLTEKEYLEQSLKLNKGKCSKENAELTKRLAELKKE